MDKQFKMEVYRDLEKWIASQNALARKKTNLVVFKGHRDLNKKKLLTMIVKDALENRVKIFFAKQLDLTRFMFAQFVCYVIERNET